MSTYDFLVDYVTNPTIKAVNRQNYCIDGELVTYSTTICKIVGNIAKFNERKYSATTSKLQSQLKNLLERHGYTIEPYNGNSAYMWNGGYCSADNKWTVRELKERGIF